LVYNIVFLIDTSLSMRKSYNDLTPNKLSAVRDAVDYVAIKMLKEKNMPVKLGMTVFFGKAYPLLCPTRDYALVLDALSRLRIMGEGSAPGDGVIVSVKILRRVHGSKYVIMITDGGFNMGIPLDVAAIYAKNSSVRLVIVSIGKIKDSDAFLIEEAVKTTNGISYSVDTKAELFSKLRKIVEDITG